MFSSGERLGMFFPGLAGSFSFVSVSSVLLLAVFRSCWGRRSNNPDVRDNILFLNLMFAEFIQSIGELVIVKWMADGFVTEGRLCSAQAILQQVGGNGVALSSLSIACYTFYVIMFRRNIPKYVPKVVVLMIWIFITLVIGIPHLVHMNQKMYGNVGYWCWVRREHRTEQLLTEYVWQWTSAFLMIILYTIMFVVMRGWLIEDVSGVWYWHTNNKTETGAGQRETEEEKESKEIAKLLLLYPAVYLVCILPKSIARWLFFSGFKVSYQSTLSTSTLSSFVGLFDTILFFFTRPELVVGPTNSSESPPRALPVELMTGTFDNGVTGFRRES